MFIVARSSRFGWQSNRALSSQAVTPVHLQIVGASGIALPSAVQSPGVVHCGPHFAPLQPLSQQTSHLLPSYLLACACHRLAVQRLTAPPAIAVHVVAHMLAVLLDRSAAAAHC